MNDAALIFLRWLWENSFAAAVLCAMAMVVTFATGRKLPPMFRYGLWLLVIARLVWPTAPSSHFSIMNVVRSADSHVRPDDRPGESATAELPLSRVIPAAPGLEPSLRRSARWPMILFTIWAFGAALGFGIVCARHQWLARWVRRQPSSSEPRLLRIVAEAQGICRTQARFHRVVVSPEVAVPAVFRLRKPILLLPPSLLEDGSDDELRLVIVHELIHVKHRDTFVNWFCIAVRSVHWFNPVAWLAWRRVCAEREHVCDAAVLALTTPEQRSLYGQLLIKLANQPVPFISRSVLVPILQSKPKIHRRITMISQFKRAPLMLTALSLLVLLIIACVTFTRAAQKAEPTPPEAAKTKRYVSTKGPRRAEIIGNQLERQQARVREMQHEVDKLREELSIVGAEDGLAERVRKQESMLFEVQTEYRRLESLYQHLSGLGGKELRIALPTAAPDAQLANLTEHLQASQQKLVELTETHTGSHPDIKRITRVLSHIEKQLNDRTEGILSGMRIKLKVEEDRLQSLEKELDRVRRFAVEQAVRKRPYEDALRKLRTEEMLLEQLRLRAMQEQLDWELLPEAK